MPHAIARAGRSAAALCSAAVLALLFGSPAGLAASATPSAIQLAQAPGGGDTSIAGQIADLRQRLHITPAQQAQFDAFAQVMQQNAEATDALLRQHPPGKRRNALDELRVESQAADAEAAGLKHLLTAFQPLYESLSAAQKQATDQMFGPAPTSSPPSRP